METTTKTRFTYDIGVSRQEFSENRSYYSYEWKKAGQGYEENRAEVLSYTEDRYGSETHMPNGSYLVRETTNTTITKLDPENGFKSVEQIEQITIIHEFYRNKEQYEAYLVWKENDDKQLEISRARWAEEERIKNAQLALKESPVEEPKKKKFFSGIFTK